MQASRVCARAPSPPTPFSPLGESSVPTAGVVTGERRFSHLIECVTAEYYRVHEDVRRLQLECHLLRQEMPESLCKRTYSPAEADIRIAPEQPCKITEPDPSIRPVFQSEGNSTVHTTVRSPGLEFHENINGKAKLKFGEQKYHDAQHRNDIIVELNAHENESEFLDSSASNGTRQALKNNHCVIGSSFPRAYSNESKVSPQSPKAASRHAPPPHRKRKSRASRHSDHLKHGRNPRITQALVLLGEEVDVNPIMHLNSAFDDISRGKLCDLAIRLVVTPSFDFFFAGLIVLDGILIGLNAQDSLHPYLQQRTIIYVLEDLLKLLFFLELVVRFLAFGVRKALRSSWTRFDALMVAFSFIDFILLRVMQMDSTEVKTTKLLRVCRLARLARAVRLLYLFRTLWLLVSGLKSSATTIIWAFVLIIVLMYIFAVIGMQVIVPTGWDGSFTDPLSKSDQVAVRNFGDITSAMLTLSQVLTLDSIAVIYRPLIYDTESPTQGFLVAAYIASFIFIVSIALMNLVTAIIVQYSLEQARSDNEYKRILQEKRKEALMPELRKMFLALDNDGSGEVSIEEMDNAPEELLYTLQDLTSVDDLSELFYLVDDDDSGFVNIDEFLEGVLKASAGDTIMRLQLARIVKQCSRIQKDLAVGK